VFTYHADSFLVPTNPAMSNLTLSIDEQLIKRARMRAIEQGTSLSAKVREFLQDYVNGTQGGLAEQRAQATARLMAAIEAATVQSRPEAAPAPRARRRTLRDELYAGDFRAAGRKAAGQAARAAKVGPRR
jgi:plasmid stability protein